MKTFRFTVTLFSALIALNLSANTSTLACNPVKAKASETEATQTPQPEVTEECIINASLFTESAKVKNYADALTPWEKVYNDCPNATKNIYIFGVKILTWQMEQTKDAAQREVIFQKLMKLFDDQIKYYGNDKRTPKAQILAKKAYYYSVYKPEDIETVYPWLKEAITKLQTAAGPTYVQHFMQVSNALYKKDNSLAEQYINDYTLANGILDANSQNSNLKNASIYKQVKDAVNVWFATSGVADCEKMNEIFLPNVEKNKDNVEYLNSTMKLFKRLKCTKSIAYFTAASYSHKIAPSAESATGLGNMCFGKEEYTNAIKYYEDAVKLGETDIDIAEDLMRIAHAYFTMNQLVKTREFCKQSLAKNPNQAAPHILLGVIYAKSGAVSDDPVLAKSKYWAAVDQFVKAKNAEQTPEIVEQANSYIRSFSGHFPTKEEIFMHPELNEGKSYFVGGWINESTIVRSK